MSSGYFPYFSCTFSPLLPLLLFFLCSSLSFSLLFPYSFPSSLTSHSFHFSILFSLSSFNSHPSFLIIYFLLISSSSCSILSLSFPYFCFPSSYSFSLPSCLSHRLYFTPVYHPPLTCPHLSILFLFCLVNYSLSFLVSNFFFL